MIELEDGKSYETAFWGLFAILISTKGFAMNQQVQLNFAVSFARLFAVGNSSIAASSLSIRHTIKGQLSVDLEREELRKIESQTIETGSRRRHCN